MSRRPWNISILQLLLLTALCAMCAGVIAVSRQNAGVHFVQRLVFSPDGRWLAACYVDGSIRVWDVARRSTASRRVTLGDQSAFIDVSGARFIDDDTLVVVKQAYTPQRSDRLLLWDVRRNEPVKTIPFTPMAEIWAVSPAGGLAATSAQGMPYAYTPTPPAGATEVTIELWDLEQGRGRFVLKPSKPFHELIFSSDGKKLVAVGSSGDANVLVQLWDTDTSAVRLLELESNSSGPFAVLSGDGKRLAFLSWGWSSEYPRYSVNVCDLETSDEFARFDLGECGTWIDTIQFSEDGRRLMASTYDGEMRLWDIASRKSPEGFADSGLARLRQCDAAAFSHDGRWIATGSNSMISLWDAESFAHVADLYRDRRSWAGLAYSLGFIGWAVVWGWLARRRRARDERRIAAAEEQERTLPNIIRATLRPGRTWLKVLLIALGIGVFLAWLWAEQLQSWLGWSYAGAFVVLVPVSIIAFAVLVLGIAFVPPAIRRWRGAPYVRGIRRAEKSAGVTGRRVRVGPVTGCFFGDSQLAATFVEDYDAVRLRFEEWFGVPIEPRRPLTVMVFERTDWYEAHLDGHLPMAGVYWMAPDRQVLICEEMSLRWLTEPRRLWRVLLARYLFEQVKGFRLTAGLANVLGFDSLFDLDDDFPQRVHRRLQAMMQRGEVPWQQNPLTVTDRELAAVVFDPDRRKALKAVTAFQTLCASLAEYLLGPAAGGRRDKFGQFLRRWKRGEPVQQSLLVCLGEDAEHFQQSWQQWSLDHPTDPVGRASPEVENYFAAHVLPRIADATAPVTERADAIRHLGASGYEIGIDALIGLLRDDGSELLHGDVVWALESISGRLHGNDVASWVRWWAERREEIERTGNASTDEIYVAELAGDAAEPVLAELLEQEKPSVTGEESSGDSATPSPGDRVMPKSAVASTAETQRRMKTLWVLLLIGGMIAVFWSVYWTMYLGQEWMFSSVLGILVGVHAVTRFTGRETRNLRASTLLLSLSVLFCNIPSSLIGMIAGRRLNHPQVRQYVRRDSS